jgi:hypothetical protein
MPPALGFLSRSRRREVIDVGDWDRSVITNVPGESAIPLKPALFRDLMDKCVSGIIHSYSAVKRKWKNLTQPVPGQTSHTRPGQVDLFLLPHL